MTFHDFSQDVMPLIQGVISLLGTAGLYLLWVQIRQTNLWNRANSQHALLASLPEQEHECAFWKIVDGLQKDQSDAITKADVEIIYNNVDDWVCVKSFINKFETLCAAINAGFVDDSYAYAVHSARVCDTYYTCIHYISVAREKGKDDDIYLELQKTATRWRERYLESEGERKARLKALESSKGARRFIR